MRELGCFQVRKKLSAMNPRYGIDRFELDYHSTIDDQIESGPPHFDSAAPHLDWELPFERNASMAQLDAERFLINCLEKSGADGRMNIHRRANDQVSKPFQLSRHSSSSARPTSQLLATPNPPPPLSTLRFLREPFSRRVGVGCRA